MSFVQILWNTEHTALRSSTGYVDVQELAGTEASWPVNWNRSTTSSTSRSIWCIYLPRDDVSITSRGLS